MSVIIRLQNLPWSANALDIRQYFHGLSIPEGGVHIVGGELGDAFIAFSTDEDARQAFNRSDGKIKEIQIKLMLSSRTEMQKVIEAARKQSLAAFMQQPPQIPIIPAAIPEVVTKKEGSAEPRNEKREKRRSRSKSRERRDRSRDRDRGRDRHNSRRVRSRSRSRERRRRRDRSRSRDRPRSKERRDRSRERRRSADRGLQPKDAKRIGVWETTPKNQQEQQQQQPQQQQALNLFGTNLQGIPPPLLGTAFQAVAAAATNNRNSWPISAPSNNDHLSRMGRFSTNNNNNPIVSPRQNFNSPNFRPQDNFSLSNDSLSPLPPPQGQQQIEFRNCCVRLSPYYGGYGAIRQFFQGLFIHNTGIKFVNDDSGKRTGIVYVRFAYPEGKEQAMQRNGSLLRNQICEVVHLEDEDFEAAVDRFQPEYLEQDEPGFGNANNVRNPFQNSRPFVCLTVEELPTFAKEQDILKMFSDYSLTAIYIINKARKNITGYVKFSNSDEARKAFEDTSKHIVDTKPVVVKPCRDEVFEQISMEQNELMGHNSVKDDVNKNDFVMADSNCVILSGLPLKTTDRDIADIFSDVGIIPDNIHLIIGPMGFNGEAFCEFCSLEDAQIALEKDGMPLGSSIISVKCVPKTEMEAILGIRTQQNNLLPKNMNQRPFFHQQRNFMGPRGPPNFMAMRPPMRRFPPPMHPPNPNDMLGPPGYTVLMENVPYKAGLDEILDFFNDFDIMPDNILRKFNPNGKPSGETKVIFGSADDAYQAVEQRNRQQIRDRTIYLSLC